MPTSTVDGVPCRHPTPAATPRDHPAAARLSRIRDRPVHPGCHEPACADHRAGSTVEAGGRRRCRTLVLTDATAGALRSLMALTPARGRPLPRRSTSSRRIGA